MEQPKARLIKAEKVGVATVVTLDPSIETGQSEERSQLFAVEKGVPLPARKNGDRATKYPFMRMEVGDSFLIPCQGEECRKAQMRVSGRKPTKGKKFTTRMVEGGIRVWRVE